jgi:hypothetical protein
MAERSPGLNHHGLTLQTYEPGSELLARGTNSSCTVNGTVLLNVLFMVDAIAKYYLVF